MDGRIAEPLGRDELRALARRSDAAGAARLALHLALLGATTSAIALSTWPWLPLALFAHGVVLVFLFAPLHETIHLTAFRSRRINRFVAWFCGLVLAIPPTDFRHFHWAHHRYTQDPERDPELAVPKPATLAQYLVQLSGLTFWRDRLAALIRQAFGDPATPYLPAKEHRRVRAEACAFLSIYGAIAAASMATGSAAALLYWLVPVLLAQPVLRAFLLAEHTGCPTVPEMTRNTRTTLTTAPVRLLGWNMPYHIEHHMHPAIPFHALPRLHDRIVGTLGHVSPGYRAAHREIRATLR